MPVLPWTKCDQSWNNEKCCIVINSINSTNRIINCPNNYESPTKQYFK